ncbi:MAG: sel1 repeat family protein [Gammaproteobacteria bacterium]|nr:MAG: sel1 repeat family protein [Gammaproteobacteria bacterium]
MNRAQTKKRVTNYSATIFFCLILVSPGLAFSDVAGGWVAFNEMDYDKAISEIDKLASAGDPDASYLLGLLHDPAFHRLPSGKFYQSSYVDVAKAVTLYRRAADAGDGRAMHNLAELYIMLVDERWARYKPNDIGNLTSAALSLRRRSTPLLRVLADQGDAVAAYKLAEARRDEPFFFVAMDNARVMLELAAWQDDPASQLYLGRTFLLPRGMATRSGYTLDPPEAFAWFTVSAKRGNMHARVYQMEAAEMMPIRDHGRAEELARALLKTLAGKAAGNRD